MLRLGSYMAVSVTYLVPTYIIKIAQYVMVRSRNKSPAKSQEQPPQRPTTTSQNHVTDHRVDQLKPRTSFIGRFRSRHGTQCALKYETIAAILSTPFAKRIKIRAVKLINFIVATYC